ncbi:MAG: hypothetical protein MI750_13045 [Xanthomonadales bacterium]|nr:hypothetical protein [Xanthomonadales bacterium]
MKTLVMIWVLLLSPMAWAEGNIKSWISIESYTPQREVADMTFARQDYVQAFSQYLALAESGDKVSQYKLALMYYFGLGVDVDRIEATAWAMVAQERGMDALRRIAQLFYRELGNSEKALLIDRIHVLDIEYGAVLEPKNIRDQRRLRQNCTGSRVGRACDRVQSPREIFDSLKGIRGNRVVAFHMKQEELEAFEQNYNRLIWQEFDHFDRLKQTR